MSLCLNILFLISIPGKSLLHMKLY